MKTLARLAILALAIVGCSYRSETVVQKRPRRPNSM